PRHCVMASPRSVLEAALDRSVLDLSLQWRFARLPNNAKLEMVPVPNRGGIGDTVRIALQLDDGSRLQDTFHCQQTLWELLNHFAKIREFMEQPGEFSPVCIYMRDEVRKDALEKTTLKSLGLTGGSAIIRLGGAKLGFFIFPFCSDGELILFQIPKKSTKKVQKDKHREPKSTPFVPFFGDGQRLGDSSVAAPSLGLDMPSSKMPTTFSSPGGPSKPKKSKNSQELQKEQEQLVEREPLVCHLDLLEPLPAGPEELPDEFFEVTVDDVRKRLAQLQSERKRLEEAPLMTKSLREAQLKEKLERYPKVVLRVHFPDRHVLQGFFRPSETGKSHLQSVQLQQNCHFTCVSVLLVIFSLTLQSLFLAVVHMGSRDAMRYDLGRNSFPKYNLRVQRCHLLTWPRYASA
uniref:ASPSCR1 tether for SLC2A4, UBX domain containing n=1 Tax=Bubo bubo TaxID=30461 RepID=A0A8C0G1T7_BUBBB